MIQCIVRTLFIVSFKGRSKYLSRKLTTNELQEQTDKKTRNAKNIKIKHIKLQKDSVLPFQYTQPKSPGQFICVFKCNDRRQHISLSLSLL